MTPSKLDKITLVRFGESFRSCTELRSEPLRALQPGELLIKNVYAGVNGIFDHNSARNKVSYMNVTLPMDMGVEAAGLVIGMAPDVAQFDIGDAVVAAKVGTGYRTFQIVPADRVRKVNRLTPEILALYPTGISGLLGLEVAGRLSTDEVVSVSAAAGGLGHLVVQIAKRAGNHVVAFTGSEEKATLVKSLGADRVINYKTENVDAVLSEEYPQGINLVYESVGGALFDTLVEHLAIKGRMVITGYTSDATSTPESVLSPRIYTKLYYKAAGIQAYQNAFYPELHDDAADRLIRWYEQGDIRVMIDPVPFEGLEQAADAVDHLMAGRNLGKVILKIQDP